jgi:hypothetical protein
MLVIIGPILTRERGYAFDSWSPGDGLRRGYIYHRIEDAYYARNVEIRARGGDFLHQTVNCNTLDDFMRSTTGSRPQQELLLN